ncbi:hypothetical protein [Paraburkholderia tuberum]|uniref:hypothetical protein n=1 Tax=Paraburkholderia tuberum TaxID=157910 RepID=UPI00115FCFBF|nr:hypothetical protein [Paraburkholderia tuberum]
MVCYSRSKTTAELAGRLASELEGDHERMHEVEVRRRAGPLGFLRSILDVVRKRPAHLQAMTAALLTFSGSLPLSFALDHRKRQ